MKGIMIDRYGGAEVLQLRTDLPRPQAGPGQVLVKVASAGVNFMDVHTRQGKYATSVTYPVRLPCTLGMEGAGVVVEVGAGVGAVAPGDRVAWCIAWGAYAEYASVPAERLARIPDEVPFDLAAAALFQASTARYLIDDVARLKPGMACLIHAASGNIGQLLVQMAKQAGATVYATASTPQKRAVALARGADHALPYGEGAFADQVRTATDGVGVDVVFDSVGKATLRDSFRACRTRGLVINYGNVSGSVSDLDPIELGEAGSLFLTRPRLADHMADGATVQRRADAVFAAILSGALAINLEGHYALEEVNDIHRRIEARDHVGKSVIRVDPSLT